MSGGFEGSAGDVRIREERECKDKIEKSPALKAGTTNEGTGNVPAPARRFLERK